MPSPYGMTVGGLLNRDLVQPIKRFATTNPLDAAAIATMPVPIVGDVTGLLADANMYYNEPEERTLVNAGLSSLGILPFVPSAAAVRAAKKYGGDPRLIKNPDVIARAGDDISEAAIGQGGKLIGTTPKTYKAGKDYKKDFSEMEFEFVPTEGGLLAPKTLTPEEMVGSGGNVLLGLLGDRTNAGGLLTRIGDNKIEMDPMQGGPRYAQSQAQMKDGSVWASAGGIPAQIQNRINAAGQEYDDVLLGYTSMGGRSGDASTHMSDALMAQLKVAGVTRKAAKEFDVRLKNVLPEWPGLNSKNAQSFLDNTTQGNRKKFVELMSLDTFQGLGFPNVPETRLAITQPELVHLPTGYGGNMVSRGIPGAELTLDPEYVHKTYDKAIKGEYLGGLERPLPRQVMFPDIHKKFREEGRPFDQDNYVFEKRGGEVRQPLDQEWLDGTMQYYDDLEAGIFD